MAWDDRYGGAAAWDALCAEDDAAYASACRGATCLDCGERLEANPGMRSERVAWCPHIGGYVGGGDTPLTVECGRFAA